MADRDPPPPLSDAEIGALQSLLDTVPPPLQPLDVSAIDGFLCGVLLQPKALAPSRWLPYVGDIDARPLPATFDAAALQAPVRRRAAELERAIAARDWFDPWVFELEGESDPSPSLLPWVAGFALALDAFALPAGDDDEALLEPLALVYRHVDAADLEASDALRAMIDEVEPAADLAEAVQDLVRAVMLIADVTRPRRETPAARARPARGRRSRSGRRERRRRARSRRQRARRATAARSSRR